MKLFYKSIWIILFIFCSYGFGFTVENLPIKMEKVAISNYPEEMIIGKMGPIVIDSNGKIFVITNTGKERAVLIFSSDLVYQSQFGRSGKGPGELSGYSRLSIDKEGNLHITDSNPSRIMIYDNNGNYTKKEYYLDRLGLTYARNPAYIGDGNYTAFFYDIEKNYSIGIIFSLSNNPIQYKSIFTFPEKQIIINTPELKGSMQGTNQYGEQDVFDSNYNNFVYANSQEFRFIVYDSKGNIVCKVEDPKRMKNNFSDDEMGYIRNNNFKWDGGLEEFKHYKDKIRTGKHFINQVRISNDRVYVFTFDDIRITDRVPVEIYNFKGILIKKGTMPDFPRKIWKNYAYFVEIDAEDTPNIVKYKILE